MHLFQRHAISGRWSFSLATRRSGISQWQVRSRWRTVDLRENLFSAEEAEAWRREAAGPKVARKGGAADDRADSGLGVCASNVRSLYCSAMCRGIPACCRERFNPSPARAQTIHTQRHGSLRKHEPERAFWSAASEPHLRTSRLQPGHGVRGLLAARGSRAAPCPRGAEAAARRVGGGPLAGRPYG